MPFGFLARRRERKPPPSVSLLLTTYRHAPYVREAVESALAQDYDGDLEILVSDDASDDGTFEIVEEVVASYDGPHRVRVDRNPENVGPHEHNDMLVKRATGDLIVRCHGDDVCEPHRVSRVMEVWRKHQPTLITSNALLIDEDSNVQGRYMDSKRSEFIRVERIVDAGWTKHLLGATFSWHRRMWEVFGPLRPEEIYRGGDRLIAFRSGLLDGVYFVHEPLVRYRQHSGQMTRGVADRTRDELVFQETLKAHALIAWFAMVRELDRTRSALPGKVDAGALRKRLIERIVAESGEWARLHNRLLLEGRRPTWLDRSELDARAVSNAFAPEADA